jgi:hypothetical protein
MEVDLMIPCYIAVFYPRAGIPTFELLERLGVESKIHECGKSSQPVVIW